MAIDSECFVSRQCDTGYSLVPGSGQGVNDQWLKTLLLILIYLSFLLYVYWNKLYFGEINFKI